MICFSLDKENSFQNVSTITKYILRIKDEERTVLMLVGTKLDQNKDQSMNSYNVEDFKIEFENEVNLNFSYIETSAWIVES